jgi:ribosomal protein S18 acetylase RimI-like enzyme
MDDGFGRRSADPGLAVIEIRRAIAADAPTLSRIGTASFIETFGHLYKEEDLLAFLAKNHAAETYQGLLVDPDFALWIAETSDGEAVAYCVAGPCSLPVPDMPPKSGELARLYLLAAHKGQGLGVKMLDIALAWLKERYDHVYLSVYYKNVRAQKLYQGRGFVKIHDYFYMVGDHADPEWIMELRRPG